MTQFLSLASVQVFLGTLPLLCTIGYGMYSNSKRLGRVEKDIGEIKATLQGMETRIDTLGERVSKIEGKIEGGRVVVEH